MRDVAKFEVVHVETAYRVLGDGLCSRKH